MPRQRNLVTAIRDLVQQEVRSAIQSLLGMVSSSKPKAAKNGRRRRRKVRGKWRPGGPGRLPKAVAKRVAQKKKAVATPLVPKAKNGGRRHKRRAPGRPPGSKNKRV